MRNFSRSSVILSILIACLTILLAVISYSLKPAEVSGRMTPYLVYHPLELGDGSKIAKKLQEKGISAGIILRVKGSLPYEVLEASGEASQLMTHVNDTGINISNFHLAVDILGVDGQLARSLVGRDDFLLNNGCLVSKPLFEALNRAYGTDIDDSIWIEVYTGTSVENFTCRVAGTFQGIGFMLDDMVLTSESYLGEFLSKYSKTNLTNLFSDEMIVLYVDDPSELAKVRKFLPCSNCLFPLSSIPS